MVQPTQRSLPQRLAVSAATSVVVALLVMLVFGVANANDGSDATLSFPAAQPMLGDVAWYSVMWPGENGTWDGFEFSLQWRDGGVLRLPDGTEPQTNLLALQFYTLGDGPELAVIEGEWRVYHSGTALVGFGGFLEYVMTTTTPMVDPVPLVQQQTVSEGMYDHIFFNRAQETSCLVNGLSGQVLRPDATVALGPCSDMVFEQNFNGTLTPLGEGRVGDLPTLRFRAGGENSTTEVDFAAGIPYPVRVEAIVDPWEPPGNVYTLIGLERGTEPLQAPPTIVTEERPTLEFVPRTGPLLLDDATSPAEFPLSLAFVKARDNPADRGFATWLSEHPAGVVADADFDMQYTDDGTIRRGWTLIATDGDSSYSVSVGRNTAQPAEALPPAVRESLAVYSINQVVTEPLAPFAVPDAVPTTSSLLALGEWHGVGDQCYGYGESAMSLVSNSGQRGYQVGQCSREYGPALESEGPGVVTRLTLADRMLVLDEHGKEWARGIVDVQSDQAETPPLGSGSGLEPKGATVSPAPRGAWTPSPAQAVGIGLFGIAAGLVAFLWMSLKGTLVGLFSRVHGPAVADHPVRAKILQAIESQPGIHFRALQRLTRESNGNLVHHLGKLEKEGMVRRVSGSGYTSYVLGSAKQTVDASPALRAPGARKLIDAARASPGASLQELAQATGLGLSTVHHHLGRLEAAGAIRVDRSGKSLQVRVADS